YRVGVTRYGSMDLPVLRGTASMSGLGWGELLAVDDEVIGVLTGHNGREILAVTGDTVARFVRAATRQPYRGFAHRGFAWQALNSDALKAHFGQQPTDPGVLIRTLYVGGTGSDLLRSGDILTRLGPYEIDPEGDIDHPAYGAIRFTLALNEATGDTLAAEIIRDGERRTLALQRSRFGEDVYRVHPYEFDAALDYAVFGGLVVQELSLDYLKRWGADWDREAPVRLLIEMRQSSLRRKGEPPERVLLINRVLPDPVNLGYEIGNAIVSEVNGRRVAGLTAFREAVRHPQGAFHVIRLLGGQGRSQLVFRAAEVAQADARIRQTYGIPTAQ
ncbi:MAG: hypothetical protein HY342_12680, partial [Candidatus Lambdaproteobacteria bacterium]|nr:hypothetical protein [Candidatus Lambdaproteobacteria bacterium]